jgi:DNA-binding response OmpR family regulator
MGNSMAARILLVEARRSDHPSFSAGLTKKGYEIECVPNGNAALTRLESIDPDMVIVDAASLRTSGVRICQSLRQKLDGMPIVLVTNKTPDPEVKVEADIILTLPFTVLKLSNRIRPLLPVEEKDLLHVGPIRLYVDQKKVRCLGKQSRLTPRLVMLLKALMEHPGEVVERGKLFSLVWETEYTGDTRTLDVHVSWLRQEIESDPRHPRFLKTVRGVGYRLDI